MHSRTPYNLPSLLLIVGSGGIGLLACSSNAKLGSDNEPTTAFGGAVGSGGSSHIVPPTGGKAAATTTAAGTSTGGSAPRPPLPKACHGIEFDTQAADADAGTVIDADAGDLCAGLGIEIEPAPLDMFIMMDRTMSMTYKVGATSLIRWDVLEKGVDQFLNDPAVVAISADSNKSPRVGLGFFSYSGNPDDPLECDPAAYEQPLIGMEAIATGGPKILNAIKDQRAYLGGQTAWFPALKGALMNAQDWKSQPANSKRMTVVVFVTDGYPTECDQDQADITEMVGEYYAGVQGAFNTRGGPSIRTYVVGISVDPPFNLNAVAQAGGTGFATNLNNDGAIDQFVNTMVNITGAEIRCTYPISKPTDGRDIDPDKVQVVYKPFASPNKYEQFPMARTAADCNGTDGGWYFDNPRDPKTITLCPCTCANLGAGTIQMRFGCGPIHIIG